jgi:hypothetical protein
VHLVIDRLRGLVVREEAAWRRILQEDLDGRLARTAVADALAHLMDGAVADPIAQADEEKVGLARRKVLADDLAVGIAKRVEENRPIGMIPHADIELEIILPGAIRDGLGDDRLDRGGEIVPRVGIGKKQPKFLLHRRSPTRTLTAFPSYHRLMFDQDGGKC